MASVLKCDLDLKKCVVKGGQGFHWWKMPSDIVSFAVTTGFGVSVLAGIISGVCYVVSQGLQKKRSQKPGKQWHCNVCGVYLRSIEGVLEGERVVTCIKCTGCVCKNRCSTRSELQWICNICSKTPESWLFSVLKIIQPSKVSWRSKNMEQDSLRELKEELKAMREKEKAEIRDFIERLVNAMLGENVDDACVSKLYEDKTYLSVFERYHQDLSNALNDLGSALRSSVANLPVSGQSPCTAHSLLKQLIHRLIRDAQDLPSLDRPETGSPVPSVASNETYEDLLATAIINKVISSCQNNLPSSSANSVSSRLSTSSRTRDDKEYYFGDETLDSKWKTTDLDTTSVSSLEEWLHNNENHMGPRQKYVDKVTLTIKQNIEEVANTDSEAEAEEEDDKDYFKNNSLINEDDANWFLQKRQFQGTHSPVPVPMLVPDPTGDAKVLIGDKEVDDTSDLSDIASDYGETEATPGVNTLLVDSKTVIGGKNMLESLTMGSDGELSADSGVREEKDFDEFGSNSLIEQGIPFVEAVNTRKTDITVDDDNVEDVSITSTYSNTEKDTEYTERYASLPRRIEKTESLSKYDRKRPNRLPEEKGKNVQEVKPEETDEEAPEVEFNGSYSKKEREKWKNAIKMDNNPYSKENIEKRLNRSSSSVSSLFGTDYYVRQASAPAGVKSKGENKLPVWPQQQDEEEPEENVYIAKQIEISTSDSDDNQLNVEEKTEVEETEVDSPMVEVEDEEIHNKETDTQNLDNEKTDEQIFKVQVEEEKELEVVLKEAPQPKPRLLLSKTNSTTAPTVVKRIFNNKIVSDNFEADSKPQNGLEKTSDLSISDFNSDSDLSYNMYDVSSGQVYKTHGDEDQKPKETNNNTTYIINNNSTFTNNNLPSLRARPKNLVLERQRSTPVQTSSFNEPPSVIKRKKDNTLISMIYMDPNVRKEALNKRNFTPELENSPVTPTFRPLTAPATSSPKPHFRFPVPSVQSVGIKVDDDLSGFETQEVQTNLIYSSEDSGDFLETPQRSLSVDKLDEDSIKEEYNKEEYQPNGLGKFSKSTPNLTEIKSRLHGSTDSLDIQKNEEQEEEEIKISVKELKKLFEKNDAQKKGPIVHSLTARSVGRRVNTFKFS